MPLVVSIPFAIFMFATCGSILLGLLMMFTDEDSSFGQVVRFFMVIAMITMFASGFGTIFSLCLLTGLAIVGGAA